MVDYLIDLSSVKIIEKITNIKDKKMIVIGTITFPESQANEVAECYNTLPVLPDFITITDTYVYNNPGEDHRGFSIFKFDEARIDEAKIYFKARYDAFEKVEDLTSKHEEWLNVQDALDIVAAGDYDLKTF